MSGRGRFRSMPADFEEHKDKTFHELMERYHAGSEVIRRWKDLSGCERPRGGPKAVIRTDWQGKEKQFSSIVEAARCTRGGAASKICHALHRGGQSCGYWWRYAEAPRDRALL